MPRESKHNPVPNCPLTAAVAAIGGKWKLIIIYQLSQSPQHFAALHRLMPGISQKVLTDQLREMENDGIVERRQTEAVPAPVIYFLNAYGRSLLPVLDSVPGWGRTHLARHNAAESHPPLEGASKFAKQISGRAMPQEIPK
ncbi:MAG TPA: helix-turn-helix domain-containing protein [Rhizomicrobium sp.]|jgi:DNA-binding HxlR family transcriptional regulator|nr:helix-turn-helix domain-containing protein [Rhizomicrobium sp.]